MDTDRLINNIIEQIKEAQLKLGFAKESIRLYYPAGSLGQLLQVECQDAEKLCGILKNEKNFRDTELGTLHFAVSGGRIEVCVSSQGADYVHEYVPEPPFLAGFIRLFQDRHALSVEEICRYFAGFNRGYVCKKMEPGQDFDYVFYFPDGEPDAWFYCIRMEMGHTIYHRFTKEDYRSMVQ